MMSVVIVVVVCLVVGYYLVTKWGRGGECTSMARLEGRTVLITGANTGIGKETALDLARRGANVHILCRNIGKGKAAAEEISNAVGKQVSVHSLDVSSLESVRECVKKITDELKLAKIDILINNAGVMACPFTKTKDGFELQFATNHLGHFLLTLELLPLIRKGKNPRIVTVSSLAHKYGKIHFDDINFSTIAYRPFKAYYQSKLANILFTRELARREEESGSGVTANCLHPGVVKTELTRQQTVAAGVFHFLTQILLAPFFKTPESGAQTTIFCAVDETLEGVTGKYYADCKEVETSELGNNMEDAARLWEESLKMVKKNH